MAGNIRYPRNVSYLYSLYGTNLPPFQDPEIPTGKIKSRCLGDVGASGSWNSPSPVVIVGFKWVQYVSIQSHGYQYIMVIHDLDALDILG